MIDLLDDRHMTSLVFDEPEKSSIVVVTPIGIGHSAKLTRSDNVLALNDLRRHPLRFILHF